MYDDDHDALADSARTHAGLRVLREAQDEGLGRTPEMLLSGGSAYRVRNAPRCPPKDDRPGKSLAMLGAMGDYTGLLSSCLRMLRLSRQSPQN